MNKLFAIGDLHGRFDLLQMALENVVKDHHLVVCGDMIDRGPQSKQIVDTLMNRENTTVICGNHEDMLIEAYDNREFHYWARSRDSHFTLESFKDGRYIVNEDDHKYIRDCIDQKYIDWFKSLPIYYKQHNRIFVHGGLNDQLPLEEQVRECVLWLRTYRDYNFHGLHVVHGHTPNYKPITTQNKTNLDTWAVGTGILWIAEFDDQTPEPIQLHSVKGLPDPNYE